MSIWVPEKYTRRQVIYWGNVCLRIKEERGEPPSLIPKKGAGEEETALGETSDCSEVLRESQVGNLPMGRNGPALVPPHLSLARGT